MLRLVGLHPETLGIFNFMDDFFDLEEWRDIEGREGRYQASTLGNIRSLDKPVCQQGGLHTYKGFVFKQYIGKNGYNVVGLSLEGVTKTLYSHRLIAETFLPNPENKRTVNHINGIKTDNRLSNLEWATYSENHNHAFKELGRKGSWTNKFGKNHCRSIPIVAINIKTGESVFYESGSMAEKDGFSGPKICNCCKGKKKTHKGHKWAYANE